MGISENDDQVPITISKIYQKTNEITYQSLPSPPGCSHFFYLLHRVVALRVRLHPNRESLTPKSKTINPISIKMSRVQNWNNSRRKAQPIWMKNWGFWRVLEITWQWLLWDGFSFGENGIQRLRLQLLLLLAFGLFAASFGRQRGLTNGSPRACISILLREWERERDSRTLLLGLLSPLELQWPLSVEHIRREDVWNSGVGPTYELSKQVSSLLKIIFQKWEDLII